MLSKTILNGLKRLSKAVKKKKKTNKPKKKRIVYKQNCKKDTKISWTDLVFAIEIAIDLR